jgi:hypothetical protein
VTGTRPCIGKNRQSRIASLVLVLHLQRTVAFPSQLITMELSHLIIVTSGSSWKLSFFSKRTSGCTSGTQSVIIR